MDALDLVIRWVANLDGGTTEQAATDDGGVAHERDRSDVLALEVAIQGVNDVNDRYGRYLLELGSAQMRRYRGYGEDFRLRVAKLLQLLVQVTSRIPSGALLC